MKRRVAKTALPFTFRRAGGAGLLAACLVLLAAIAADAAPLRIVAIGASNTQGWYVGKQGAYPAQLEALLKAKGVDAQVTNAGVPFDTTAGMLKRIDADVPQGTDIVILQPGANDRRFLGTKEQRAANIAAMERRLRARSIKVVTYDDDIPLRYYAFDFIHLTHDGHAMIAAALLSRIMATIGQRPKPAPAGVKPPQP
jgi:acyl-CoA thioesterase-1